MQIISAIVRERDPSEMEKRVRAQSHLYEIPLYESVVSVCSDGKVIESMSDGTTPLKAYEQAVRLSACRLAEEASKLYTVTFAVTLKGVA